VATDSLSALQKFECKDCVTGTMSCSKYIVTAFIMLVTRDVHTWYDCHDSLIKLSVAKIKFPLLVAF